MITNRIVLVLGAGASFPYKFPLGVELVRRIREKLPRDFIQFEFAESQAEQFLQALKDADPLSVDAFLEHRPTFVPIGKTAIAAELISCESPTGLTGDWYQYLLEKMISPLDKFADNRLSVITFNYDRSFEQYLFRTLSARYGKTSREIAFLLEKIPILHPHGQLGYLPWQEKGAEATRPYENVVNDESVKIAAEGIKIVSDAELERSKDFQTARDWMQKAEAVFVLGFAYHRENMKRLLPPLDKTFGSCFGLRQAEQARLTGYHFRGLRLFEYDASEFLRKVEQFQDVCT
jgi:hypothetical protein